MKQIICIKAACRCRTLERSARRCGKQNKSLLPSGLGSYRFARQPEIKSFSAVPVLIDYG
jgi:hypothetical protein